MLCSSAAAEAGLYMQIKPLHRWDVSCKEAVLIQEKLRRKLLFSPLPRRVRYVAGVDVSYCKARDRLFGAVVVCGLPDLQVVESVAAKTRAVFPYVPGFLSFREVPVLCRALRRLKILPDAIICDAQGLAHPRGFGLACHLGLILDLPCVGCAKSLLVGSHAPLAEKRYSCVDLVYQNQVVGRVLRSRTGVRPIYVSPGHKIDLEGALNLVESCLLRYRLPEPVRLAHILSNRLREEYTNLLVESERLRR